MAVIRQKTYPSGKIAWEVIIRRAGRSTSKTWSTEENARKYARREEARIERAAALGLEDVSDCTLDAALDRYEKHRLPQLAAATQNWMTCILNKWRSRIGGMKLTKITKAVIAAELEELAGGKSTGAHNRYRGALSAVLSKCAGEWGLLEYNPCHKIPHQHEKGRERYLQPDEQQALLEACAGSKHSMLHSMLVLSLSTGIRQGEMMALRWTDIDMKKGLLFVRDSKNSKPRTIPLTQTAIAALKSTQAGKVVYMGPVFGGGLFPRHAWTVAVREAGLDNFHWHDLRHTCASYLVQQGVGIRMVAEILGHSTLQMSMRYSHLATSHLVDGLEAAEKAMFGNKK